MAKLKELLETAREKHFADRLFTFEQAAKEKNIGSKFTVARWARLGKFPIVRLGPRSIRVRESDLDTFIQAHIEPAKDAAR